MEKPTSTSGEESQGLPPPYSVSDPSLSQQYGVRAQVIATAPYPVTPGSDHQAPRPVMMPPPTYYYNPMPTGGTSGNGIPAPVSNHNPTYTPTTLYNPAVVTVTPPSQRSTHWGNARNVALRFVLMLIVIMIMIIVGIGANYYIQEVL